jgi:hypothetical protein
MILQFKEEADVYDVVDQEEYAKRVESRRQMDDFVVDDGKSVCVRSGENCDEFHCK